MSTRIALVITLSFFGCKQVPLQPPSDGDGGQPDLAGDGGNLGPPVMLPGTQLYSGMVGLAGLTDGQLAILVDSQTRAILAVPLAGGSAMTLAAGIPKQTAGVDGDMVVITTPDYTNPNIADIGPIWIWTPSGGHRQLSTRSYDLVGPIRNHDATRVVYVDNLSTDGTTGDLILSKSDGSMKQTLATSISTGVDPNVSGPNAVWVGTHLVYSITTPAGVAEAYRIDPGGSPQLVAGAALLGAGTDGTHALVFDQSSNLSALDAGSGATQAIDSSVSVAEFMPNGQVLYTDQSGALKRATLGAPPSLVVLQNQWVLAPLPIFSPDGNWALAVDGSDSGTDDIVSTVSSASLPVQLPNVSGLSLQFTSDSTTAYFLESSSVADGSVLQTLPTGGGVPKSWSSSSFWAQAGRASQVVFNDNGTLGKTSDLRVADISNAHPSSTLLATPIDWQWFFVTADKTRVAFTSPAAGHEGLYLLSLP